MSPAPLVVVHGAAALEETCADLAAVGWVVRPGWAPAKGAPVAEVLAGAVGVDAEIAGPVLAAAMGTGVVVDTGARRDLTERVCDDLRRLGPVEHRAEEWVVLAPDERALLDLLATGASLGTAAARVHLSRRSADRRLAEARRRLGLPSTAAAVAVRRERVARLPRPSG